MAGEGGAEAGGATGDEDGEVFEGGEIEGLGDVDGWGLDAVDGEGGAGVRHVGYKGSEVFSCSRGSF